MARGNGENSTLTQQQANELYEGPKLDMANRFANTSNLFLTTIFYTPLIPIAPIVAMLGTFFSYMIDKWMLVRRHSRPD